LEHCAEIIMQGQYAVERKIGSDSNETFNRRGAAQCRESAVRAALSTNPLAISLEIRSEARSFCGKISA